MKYDLKGVARFVAVCLMVLVGTASGAYFGFSYRFTMIGQQQAIVTQPLTLVPDSPAQDAAAQTVNLHVGERFPNEFATAWDGSETEFKTLFDGTPTVIMFWSLECESCVAQAELWSKTIEPVIMNSIKQVVCLADGYGSPIPKAYSHLLEDKILFFPDFDLLGEKYYLLSTPTIIALDGQGIIQHVQEFEGSTAIQRGLYDFLVGA